MDLAELSDRQEITDLVTAYTRAIDTSSWNDLYAVFTPDAVLDYVSSGGPIGPLDEVIPFVRNLEGFTAWQHTIGQVAITFDEGGETAKAIAYFINPLIAASPDGSPVMLEVGGYYHHDVVRTPDGWKSKHMVDELVWTR